MSDQRETSELLPRVDIEAYLRRHEQRFFRSGQFDPVETCTRIANEALLMGTTIVSICHHAQWWLVTGDRDWLPAVNPLSPFQRIVSFPEGGPNSLRPEVLVATFARDVVTSSDGRLQVIKGESDPTIERLLAAPEPATRAIAFRP